MKIFIQSPDASNRIDDNITRMILPYLDVTQDAAAADVTLIPVSFLTGFKFNPALERIAGKTCIIDLMEYEWLENKEEVGTHLFGVNTSLCRWLKTPDWQRFCDWVKANPPCVYFKRELRKVDETEKILPIEFPCVNQEFPLQNKHAFDSRRFEVFYSWGYSHPSRPLLHAEIFKQMASGGPDVISDWNHIAYGGFGKRVWASIYAPHYSRKPIDDVVLFQSQAKISVSLPGAGVKCFRHSESPVNSVMALHYDDLAWSFPWVHGLNCVRMEPGAEIRDLNEALADADLWNIYLESQVNIGKYRAESYAADYLMPAIAARL